MADRIALLLHMHQPEYRDPESGRPTMPWVRLHASRGYTDVAALALETGATPTINVVPSLLLQLEAYREGGTDRWEELSRRPAEELFPEEVAFLRRYFVTGNPTMRAGSPRYLELAARAATPTEPLTEPLIGPLTEPLTEPQDLRDLQVWSNLAWMGVIGRRDPLVQELRARDRDFSHEELIALMDLQRRMVGEVLDLWSRLPSLSCSPLCHPILPLLVDFRHARRCLPQLPRDLGPASTFRWPQDALRQLVEGREVCQRLLGRAPQGLWPSEGSVSPEVLDLARQAGFSWVASDEGVLHRSERDRESRVDGPWVQAGDESGLRLVFRDHTLSDRVGFVYQRWDGEAAAADLLAGARERWGWGPGAVPVILDGENPWEAFPDAGEAFMGALFRSGRVCSVDQLVQQPAIGRVRRLHTGSWIDADFRIWAGDPQDRAAWGLLAQLRQAWKEAGCPEDAWRHLANAESSDWTWWFGPEHHSEVADLFDALFRAHLAAGWRALGGPVPEALARPVQSLAGDSLVLKQRGRGRPRLDGALHPADWARAASIPPPTQGSMSRGRSWLHGGAIVGDGHHLSLRLDLDPEAGAPTLEREGQPPIALVPTEHADPTEAFVRREGGLLLVRFPYPGGETRFALVSAEGERHPPQGWFQLVTSGLEG